MKSKQSRIIELETELLRLNEMVRARRRQLARLEECPNKDCECRAVWRQVTEENLSSQMQKIGKGVRRKTNSSAGRKR